MRCASSPFRACWSNLGRRLTARSEENRFVERHGRRPGGIRSSGLPRDVTASLELSWFAHRAARDALGKLMLDALFRPWQTEPPVGGQPRAAKGRTSQARLPEIFMGVPSGS